IRTCYKRLSESVLSGQSMPQSGSPIRHAAVETRLFSIRNVPLPICPLLRPGPAAILHREVGIAWVLGHQQMVYGGDVGFVDLIFRQAANIHAVGDFLIALQSVGVAPGVVVEQKPAIVAQELVGQEEGHAVDGPVLAAVDEYEIVAGRAYAIL